jgi:hypothetical protein
MPRPPGFDDETTERRIEAMAKVTATRPDLHS